MENASKALIIAGAILISILLISVGVLIMNSTGDTTKSVQDFSETTAAKTFNAQFTPYEGEGQSAGQIRSLVSAVSASNGKHPDHKVKWGGTTSDTTPPKVSTKNKYEVVLTYGDDGYVSTITVSVDNSGNTVS